MIWLYNYEYIYICCMLVRIVLLHKSNKMKVYKLEGLMETSRTIHGRIVCQVSGWLIGALVDPEQIALV